MIQNISIENLHPHDEEKAMREGTHELFMEG